MNQETDKGHDEKHQERNRVEVEGDLGAESAAAHPCPQVLNILIARGRRCKKRGANDERDQCGEPNGASAQKCDRTA